MSSFLDDSKDNRIKGTSSEFEKTVKSGEADLFPNSSTNDANNITGTVDLNTSVQIKQSSGNLKNRGGSSNRKYRKQNKKFKGKEIEIDFQLHRNDPLFNINNLMSNNNATNQTMPMFASSNVASPMMSNMGIPTGFVLCNTTK